MLVNLKFIRTNHNNLPCILPIIIRERFSSCIIILSINMNNYSTFCACCHKTNQMMSLWLVLASVDSDIYRSCNL